VGASRLRVKQVWEEEKMTTDWRTGLIFPIFKKEVKINVKIIQE